MLQSNKGKEFVNSNFQQMLSSNNVHFYISDNEDIKASVVERFNRILKLTSSSAMAEGPLDALVSID